MKTLSTIVQALSVPLFIFHLLGGLVSIIWLVILGEWGSIFLGVAFVFGWSLFIGIGGLPIVFLTVFLDAACFAEKSKSIRFACIAAFNLVYAFFLITVWCSTVLFVFVYDAIPGNLLPRLFCSYWVAIGPWAKMASNDSNIGSTFATFLAWVNYVVIMFLLILTSTTLLGAIEVFAVLMLGSLMAYAIFAVSFRKQQIDLAHAIQGGNRDISKYDIDPTDFE